MSRYDELEGRWDRMTEDQRLLAFAKAKLAEAEYRDSFPKFKWENNIRNFWYEARTQYVYGGGKR